MQGGVRRPYRVEYTPASAFRKHASPDKPDLRENKVATYEDRIEFTSKLL